MRDRKPITCPGELLAALLRGDRVSHCITTGLRLEEADRPVDRAALQVLRQGVRVVAGGDALPGIGTSQTFHVEPLLDRLDVTRELRRAQKDAGGLSAFARTHGLMKGQVTDVDSARSSPTPAVLRSLGLVRLERYAKAPPAAKKDAAA
ncbi:hypothetical protein [Roseomonas sp. USHLN139]|uniref:hypothetical protein n=1 Tax=Roseomonas sp. USHLN139 TaxID=3081298 RepID=UPI003B028FAC